MSVTRINELQALPGQADVLWERLQSFTRRIAACPGCHSCQLLRAEDDPGRLLVIEVWDDAAAHNVVLKTFPPDAFAGTMLGTT
jgi:heme oxygenase (mycobilin-producing)